MGHCAFPSALPDFSRIASALGHLHLSHRSGGMAGERQDGADEIGSIADRIYQKGDLFGSPFIMSFICWFTNETFEE